MHQVDYIVGRNRYPGFEESFGAWLVRGEGRSFMIDAGVGGGADSLVENAKAKGLDRLDYVLISHIHLDHAGGLARVLETWPEAKAVVHEKGIRHLAEPARLWQSTQEVMGDLAETYGEPKPADPARLVSHLKADIPGLTILETPGHAVHHLSFELGGHIFVGEAGGCPVKAENGRVYGRPATAARYMPRVTLASVDLLMSRPERPAYFGHVPYPLPLKETLAGYKNQLELWDQLLREPQAARQADESMDAWLERLALYIFENDDNFEQVRPNLLPPLDYNREKFFMKNSINGFVQYHAEQGSDPMPMAG